MKNESKTYPLIERILVVGVPQEELKKIAPPNKKVDLTQISNVKIKILEDYKSNDLNEPPNENYIENINIFCMPDGLKVSEELEIPKTFTHSFSLITSESKRKHCSCLTFYENYEVKDKNISLLKALCLVSSQPIYQTHKDILENIYSIISNHKQNKNAFPEQLRYIYLKDKSKSYTVVKEYTIFEFYFSSILNSLKYTEDQRSYYVNYVGNNIGKKCFLKYHSNDKIGYPLMDFDLTILLDKFNVEDLIKIYMGLLMEYKLIIIFDDYTDINIIIFAITSILYPLKWNFPLISFITPALMETLEAPFGIIIGVHSKYMNVITSKLNQNDAFTEETLIYNLTNKNFIYLPNKFPELPLKILNELRSNIYLVLSEKLSLTSEIDNEETDLFRMFPSLECCKKIQPTAFLNLKLIQVFFNVFLELIKNLESSIYFSKIKSLKNSKERFQLYDVFDSTKFINDRDHHNDKSYFSFVEQFSKTLMFMQFLEKYIKNSEKDPKFKFIKKMILYLTTRENGKSLVKDLNRDYIKNKLISYYNFKFISLEDALKNYMEKFGSLTSSTCKNKIDDNIKWNQLENYKIINFSINFEKYLIKDSDERLKDNNYKKLYSELLKFKEYKQYEVENDEDSRTQIINTHETKMKSYLEENNYYMKERSKSKYHKPTSSYNFIDELHRKSKNFSKNTIIKCDNNIENYIFNNINISGDDNRLPIHLNLDSSSSKSKNYQHKNTIQTVDTIKTLHSISNSINSLNSSTSKPHTAVTENSTSRKINLENYESIKKNSIFNLKTMQSRTQMDSDKRKVVRKVKDLSDLMRLSRPSNSSSRNSVTGKSDCDNSNKYTLKDLNTSINISPLKRTKLINDSSNQSLSSQHNLSKLKNVENLNKLVGDEEIDIFSDGDDYIINREL